jgi:hypothetical protein
MLSGNSSVWCTTSRNWLITDMGSDERPCDQATISMIASLTTTLQIGIHSARLPQRWRSAHGTKGFSTASTAPFSGRPLARQHAGAHDLFKHNISSPAAKHFIGPGPLQRFVRRHRRYFALLSIGTASSGDSNAMKRTQAVVLAQTPAWGRLAGPYA